MTSKKTHEADMGAEPAAEPLYTCPFCGLLCDDRPASALTDVQGPVCARAQTLLQAVLDEPKRPQAHIEGRRVDLDEALAAAARLLRQAERPLLGGGATDVDGARALLALAERCGGIVDHMHGEAMVRNLQVLQGGGWMSVDLGELRNRADVVVILDGGMLARYPRLLERYIAPPTAYGGSTPRRVFSLGGPPPPPDAGIEHLALPLEALADALGTLRCMSADRVPPPAAAPLARRLAPLLESMHRARYGVLIWSAQSFEFEHGDLVIQAAADLVSQLNEHTRYACLPLTAGDGAAGLQQAATWSCGYPLRVGFTAGAPEYDPYHYAARRLLSEGHVDLLLWLASFDAAHAPPPTEVPTIVLGRPGNPARERAAVFIPVGVPGVDHAGYLFRADGIAALPLHRLRRRAVPGAAEILTRLRLALESQPEPAC